MLENLEYYPRDPGTVGSFRDTFRHYLVPAYIPAEPFILRTDSVVTQGSCFAKNIAKSLHRKSIKATWLEIQEVMNSPLANRTVLEYLLTGKPVANINHRLSLEQLLDPAVCAGLKDHVKAASAFIFTAGLAYCAFTPEGDYVLGGQKNLPATWRMTTAAENQEHIEAIIAMLRKVNPYLNIVLTVSPIPMTRAFGHGSAVVADCHSKSVLRAAVGQVMERGLPGVFYWPSFEAIRWLSGHVGPVYGVEGQDHRHPGQSYIDEILDAFVEHYFIQDDAA